VTESSHTLAVELN